MHALNLSEQEQESRCYDSLSLPPLHFISIGYTFPILFKSPFTISITKHFSLFLSLSITLLFMLTITIIV